MRKIVIAGGTGFLGKCLTQHFRASGDQVIILTRGESKTIAQIEYVQWDGRTLGNRTSILENTDMLINMNGKSVDCRYTEKNKALIYATRLDATAALGEAILECKNPPKLWINAASSTIYRHSLDREMNEETGEIGTGFSEDVCLQWEAMFNQYSLPTTRKVIIRTAIVLGRKGGALLPLKNIAQLGFGGKQGAGNQFISWLHEDDFTGIIEFIATHHELRGVYNLTSPHPVPNSVFMKLLRKTLRMPVGIGMPEWLLTFGAFLIGTEPELILKSRRVVPNKLLKAGYEFKFKDIEVALKDLIHS